MAKRHLKKSSRRKQKIYNIWKNIIFKTFSTHFFGESIHFL